MVSNFAKLEVLGKFNGANMFIFSYAYYPIYVEVSEPGWVNFKRQADFYLFS